MRTAVLYDARHMPARGKQWWVRLRCEHVGFVRWDMPPALHQRVMCYPCSATGGAYSTVSAVRGPLA